MSVETVVREAQRHRGLEPEVVNWIILTEEDVKQIAEKDDGLGLFFIQGEVSAGMVLVTNHHGASWTLSVEEFDANYQAR